MRGTSAAGAALVTIAVLAAAARAAPPPNDAFAAATVLSGPSGSIAGNTAEATREPAEPAHDEDAAGRSVWYRWTAPTSGLTVFETCRATRFDTVLAAYVGSAPAALGRMARSDDGCNEQSRVAFEAAAGTTYSIAVDGFEDAAGAFTLSWRQAAAPTNDSFAAAAPLSGARGSVESDSIGARREPGEAAGTAAATVWYRWTSRFTGGVTFDTCGSEFDTVLAAYAGTSLRTLRELAENDDAEDDDCNPGSRLRFGARAGSTYRIQVYGVDGEAGALRLAWRGARAPSNDHFTRARRVSGVSGRVAAANVGALAESGEDAEASVWYRWRAPRTMPIAFSTCRRADFDTVVTVYRARSFRGANVVESNDDACAGKRSRAVFVAAAGVEYRIAVDGFDGETGTFVLTWGRPGAFAQPCRVPDVVGRTVAAARRALLEANCGVGRIAFTSSPIVPRGFVIGQFPRPDARLPILGRVNLEVSRGG